MKTITICLDESGSFEHYYNGIRFIGGFIYEHNGNNRPWNDEKVELGNHLAKSCAEQYLKYPGDLHGEPDNNLSCMERNKIFSARNSVRNSMIDYMKCSGSYKLFAYLQDGSMPTGDSDNNLICDSMGSNLYEHMLNDAIRNVLFHAPEYCSGVKSFIVEAATRTITISDKEENQFYEKLGYSCKILDEKKRWYLTNQQTVKASIDRYIREFNIDNINLESLMVTSIYYGEERVEQTGLYAADLCCNYIKKFSGQLYKNQEAKNSPPIKTLVFIYNDVDKSWGELMQAYRKNNSKEFLVAYSNIINKPDGNNIYIDKCNKLDSFFLNMDDAAIKGVISRVKREHYYKSEYEQTRKLVETLDNCLISTENKKYNATAKYEIYDLLLSCYNHKGDIKKADEYRDKCEELQKSGAVDSDLVIEMKNRDISRLENDFRFEEGIIKIDEIIDITKHISEAKALAYGSYDETVATKNTNLGKYLSRKAQLLAFLKKYDESYEYFCKALNQIDEKNEPENRRITLSYLLHMAICKNDRVLYENYESIYFSETGIVIPDTNIDRVTILQHEFKLLRKKDKKQNAFKRFDLFIYLKALIFLYIDELYVVDLIKEIIETDYNMIGYTINEHPFELIYKYLALLSLKINNTDKCNMYFQKLSDFRVTEGNIVEIIKIAGLYEIAKEWCNSEELQKASKSLYNVLHNLPDKMYTKEYFGFKEPNNIPSTEDVISRLTYMYY